MPTSVNALAIMAKAPVAGSVKTRLVPPLTHEQAADLYRALLLDQLEHLRLVDGVARYLAYSPANAEVMMRQIGGTDYQCLPQQGDDLGLPSVGCAVLAAKRVLAAGSGCDLAMVAGRRSVRMDQRASRDGPGDPVLQASQE